MLFNIVLLIHFIAFLLYFREVTTAIAKPDQLRDKTGLILGIIILLTGVCLVALKYPVINYYKVVPKTGIFLIIAVINGVYGGKVIPRKVNYVLLGLTMLASLIAVIKL